MNFSRFYVSIPDQGTSWYLKILMSQKSCWHALVLLENFVAFNNSMKYWYSVKYCNREQENYTVQNFRFQQGERRQSRFKEEGKNIFYQFCFGQIGEKVLMRMGKHTQRHDFSLKNKPCKVLDAEKFCYKECAIRLQVVKILAHPCEAAAGCRQKEKLKQILSPSGWMWPVTNREDTYHKGQFLCGHCLWNGIITLAARGTTILIVIQPFSLGLCNSSSPPVFVWSLALSCQTTLIFCDQSINYCIRCTIFLSAWEVAQLFPGSALEGPHIPCEIS